MTERSRTPDEPEIFSIFGRKLKDEIFVARPAKVVTYDPGTQKISAKPLIVNAYLNDDGSEGKDEMPIVTDVPVLWPRTALYALTFPVSPGDLVLLVYCDRCIDDFATSSGATVTSPKDLRAHDMSDPVAIPGFYPFTKPITCDVMASAMFGAIAGAQVRARADGVDVTSGGSPTAVGGFVAMANLVMIELGKIAAALAGLGVTYVPAPVMSANLKAD